MHIYLSGMMGMGKSTVASELATRLNRKCVDIDLLCLENCESKSVSEIFSEVGENGFRAIESNVLKQISECDKPLVVSTGGGIILSSDNVKLMRMTGYVVLLDAHPEIIFNRLDISDRPLLNKSKNPFKIYQDIYNERINKYKLSSDCIVDASLSTSEICTMIIEKLNEIDGDIYE